jgi:endonuclease/exonuclease/phosphatase (EEP) superfamily protein YafD
MRTDSRNSQLRELGDFVKRSPLPTIVAGDLNSTPWSVAFRDVVSRSGLRDSALGLGVHGTWNAHTWIRIPIDHALIPPKAVVVRRAVGPDVGSDHFPLEITIAFP